jgi:endoglucanase
MTNFTVSGSTASTIVLEDLAAALKALPPVVVPPPPPPPPPPPGTFSLRVSGSKFIDGNGNPIQLRGVNVGGLEGTVDHAKPWTLNPWGNGGWPQTGPDLNAIKAWKANAVRYPLNEASWLGLTTTDSAGASFPADPGGNYKAVVTASVNAATAAGLYVILDLHWNSPDIALGVPGAALGQQPMADMDHSLAFWTSLATAFKGNPAVAFELYNEPYFWWIPAGASPWVTLRDGGPILQYVTYQNPTWQIVRTWQSAGTQAMVNAIRATGATNVILTPGIDWCSDISGAIQYLPTDSIKQLGQTWHCYPNTVHPDQPIDGVVQYTNAANMLAADIPVIVTETGEHNAAGTVGAPLMANLLPFCDANGVSVMGWVFNAWGNADNVLIKDVAGTPTDGYGAAFHAWTVNHV